jgi:acetolactate synthase I/II/III large subunit
MKDKSGVGRRSFLAGVATAGAAAAAGAANAASAETATEPVKLGPPPTVVAQADTQPLQLRATDSLHVANPGSDYMVGVVRNVNIDYLATMPGSTFRGIHESFVNHGMNAKPELISVVHEEISAGVAHGYAKIAGKPMAILVHNTVGLQHASMAIYNAWCDRAPMLILTGNIMDAANRRPGVEWDHTATDVAAIVRGYIKYDDSPVSLDSFRESTTRAYQLMTTPPFGPSLIMVDGDLAEEPARRSPSKIVPYHPVHIASADEQTLDQIAKMLVGAQTPVILAGRTARTPAGMGMLVQLAELLQAPVIDDYTRMNFPTNHYLNGSFSRAVLGQADVIIALEVGDLFGVVQDVQDLTERKTVRRIKADAKVIEINSELGVGAGNYQDKQRFYPSDIPVPADAEASLPGLIEAVRRNLTTARTGQNDQRKARLQASFDASRMLSRDMAAAGWDASPVALGRLSMEIWNQIKSEDWAFAGPTGFMSRFPQRLWDFTKPYQWAGESGGGGVGYATPALVGAALAHKGTGRLVVGVVGDGELMCAPGSLWTLAKHRIPALVIVHNNRAWHQETMHVQRMANRRDRDPSTAHIGTTIDDPNIDYAKLAQSFGLYAEKPISNPAMLGPALARAIKMVKSGTPALLDVVTQPR